MNLDLPDWVCKYDTRIHKWRCRLSHMWGSHWPNEQEAQMRTDDNNVRHGEYK